MLLACAWPAGWVALACVAAVFFPDLSSVAAALAYSLASIAAAAGVGMLRACAPVGAYDGFDRWRDASALNRYGVNMRSAVVMRSTLLPRDQFRFLPVITPPSSYD